MRLRPTLALAAATLLLLSGGITEATAGPAPVVQAADTDADDLDTSTPDNPTEATPQAATPFAAAGAPVDHCIFHAIYFGNTCFQWVGDDQWVQDLDENGWATTVHVQTNYGKNRYCAAPPKAKGWGVCNYDHKEGKCVRWRFYELKGNETRNWSAFSQWWGTEYGTAC